MGFEAWAYNEQEKKKKELDEKENSEFQQKQVEHKKMKEYIETETETEENLHKLHDLVEEGVLTKEQAEHIADGEELTQDDVQEIFDKIDEMEDLKDVDKYLPTELRITKDDYSKAMTDDIFRVQTLTKLDTVLTIIWQQIVPDSSAWVNLFSWLLTMLDKNLVLLQENTIDVKQNLNEIHDKKFPKPKLSLWTTFVNFIRELFK